MAKLLVTTMIYGVIQPLGGGGHSRRRDSGTECRRKGRGREIAQHRYRHAVEQRSVGEKRTGDRAHAVDVGPCIAAPQAIAGGGLDLERAKIILELDVVAPDLVARAAEDVIADLAAIFPRRRGQRGAARLRERHPGKILRDGRLLRHPDFLTIDDGGSAYRAIRHIGQLERHRGADNPAPVENILDAARSAQIAAGREAEGIRLAGTRILRILGLEDVVDNAVAIGVAIGEAGRDAGDFTRIEEDLAVPGIVIAITGFHLQAEIGRGRAGDESERATGGVAAEQRALRATQHLDPFDIHHVQAHGARASDIDAVDIQAIGGIDAEALAAAVGNAAHGEDGRTVAGGAGQHGDIGRKAAKVTGIGDAQLLDLVGADRADRDGNFLKVLGALLRRHDDVGQTGVRRSFSLRESLAGKGQGARPQKQMKRIIRTNSRHYKFSPSLSIVIKKCMCRADNLKTARPAPGFITGLEIRFPSPNSCQDGM